jgi:type III pantothenate kinase
MILTIDIGNTNINFALINKNGKIVKKLTTPSQSNSNIKKILSRIKNIDLIIIVSVAPRTLTVVKKYVKNIFKKAKVSIVGNNIFVPLKCEYDKKEIGQDRLVTAFAAKKIYGEPALVIDFGTAVTFDAVEGDSYLGGLILPGIKMSLESLHNRTSMLPKTYLTKVNSFIGKNTKSSIRGGMVYGYGAICDGLIKKFKKKIGKNLKIVATGGDAYLISLYTKSLKIINPDLSHKGLFFLSQK